VKVAGAPISWGVNELTNWGYRMPPDRVLAEMQEVGLRATELGPPEYLPAGASERRRLLERYGLNLVAGFLATVVHDPARPPTGEIEREAAALAASGAEVLVLAAALPGDTYDEGASLSAADWTRLAERIREADELVSSHGLDLAFHPHAGTAVATAEDIETFLETTTVDLCLDTGHVFLGGADPVTIARDAGNRVRHVHLKDVDLKVAERLQAREISYTEAVRQGLYRPLGSGDLDIESVYDRLQAAGYRGWFVLEQDTALTAEPEPGAGPVAAARQSLEYFRGIAGAKLSTSASKEE
jgi:inosose dehydratase